MNDRCFDYIVNPNFEDPEGAASALTSLWFFQDMTLRNGSVTANGGAIRLDTQAAGQGMQSASMTLTRVSITNCAAMNNGGGVSSSASQGLNLTQVSISDCTAGFNAGALLAIGFDEPLPVTLSQSTFSGNTAMYYGAVYIDSMPFFIENTTMTGNTAQHGVFGVDSGKGIITHSTIALNGMSTGVYSWNSGASITLRNTILVGNGGGNCQGTIVLDGYNLVDDGFCIPEPRTS